MLLGICEGRPLPQLPLRGAMGWAAHQRPAGPFGAISLSSDTFLQARLLPLLFDVNAQTTLLPMFSGVQRDKWKLVLKRWSDDTNRVADDCALLRAADNGDSAVLKYKWYHFDEYGHKHEGGSYVMNGMYTVSSTPYVSFPTVHVSEHCPRSYGQQRGDLYRSRRRCFDHRAQRSRTT